MKIAAVRFIKSVFNLKDLPRPGLPEIAFSGRSNVGKSSLINAVLNRKGVAKTSATPGRTQSINYFEINGSFFFVDLPGYGYAKVPATVKRRWRHLIEGYLTGRETLRLVTLIVDVRRGPHVDEARFVQWLRLQNIPHVIVMTKTDKVKNCMRRSSAEAWRKYLDVDDIILFSAVTGEGKNTLWKMIQRNLQ